ncbi:MAG: Crp/Fnr family transcriptional regulator [Bdellovibrionota bacterium]|mgnify:FL=1
MQNQTATYGQKPISLPYQVVLFERNATLPTSVDEKSGFYYIEKGHVKISATYGNVPRTILINRPGDFVGLSWPANSPSLSATAISPVTACFYDRSLTEPLSRSTDEVQAFLRGQTHGSLLRTGFRIWALQAHSVKARVAGTLLSLIDPTGLRIENISERTIETVDRRTLAELSGTVIETLSRVLTELEEAQIIIRDKRSITVLKPAALMKIAASA